MTSVWWLTSIPETSSLPKLSPDSEQQCQESDCVQIYALASEFASTNVNKALTHKDSFCECDLQSTTFYTF